MVAPVVGRPLTQVVVSEAKRNWPFVVGFAVTFTLVTKLSTSLDQKEAHKSKFVNPYGHHWYGIGLFPTLEMQSVNFVLLAVTLALQSEPGLYG